MSADSVQRITRDLEQRLQKCAAAKLPKCTNLGRQERAHARRACNQLHLSVTVRAFRVMG